MDRFYRRVPQELRENHGHRKDLTPLAEISILVYVASQLFAVLSVLIENEDLTPKVLLIYALFFLVVKGISLTLDRRVYDPSSYFLYLWEDGRSSRTKSLPFEVLYLGFICYHVLVELIFCSLLPTLVWCAHPEVKPFMKIFYTLYSGCLVWNCLFFMFDPWAESIELPGYPRISRSEV